MELEARGLVYILGVCERTGKLVRELVRDPGPLKKGDKTGNGGCRRFLATTGENGLVIDRAKAEEDARFNGVFVLRTNTDLAPQLKGRIHACLRH